MSQTQAPSVETPNGEPAFHLSSAVKVMEQATGAMAALRNVPSGHL